MKEHYLLVRVEKRLLTRQPNTFPAPFESSCCFFAAWSQALDSITNQIPIKEALVVLPQVSNQWYISIKTVMTGEQMRGTGDKICLMDTHAHTNTHRHSHKHTLIGTITSPRHTLLTEGWVKKKKTAMVNIPYNSQMLSHT